MPILLPGAMTPFSHSLVVGTPRFPALMRIQLEVSCCSACRQLEGIIINKTSKSKEKFIEVKNRDAERPYFIPGGSSVHLSKEPLYLL